MKSNIHPDWNTEVTVTCSCGSEFKTGSAEKSIHVDICSNCHPFYTGEMRFVDVQGRVEKFQAKQKKGASYKSLKKNKLAKKVGKSNEPSKSLKDMLTDIKKNSPQEEQEKE